MSDHKPGISDHPFPRIDSGWHSKRVLERRLEFDSPLKSDHANRGITAKICTQQPGLWRGRLCYGAKTCQRRCLPRNSCVGRGWLEEIRMVEQVIELRVELEAELLRNLESLADVEVS